MLIYTIIILAVILLILMSAWLSGTETAFSNLSQSDLAQMKIDNVNKKEFVFWVKRNMNKAIATILVLNNLIKIILASLVALFANRVFHTFGLSLAIGLITFIITIFGEINPKARGLAASREICLKRAKSLYYLVQTLTPISRVFLFISKKFLKLRFKPQGELSLSKRDIKSLVSLGKEEGLIKNVEKKIIYRTFDFGQKKAKDVMIPMKKVFYINKGCSIEYARQQILEKGFTRVPVMNPDKEKIVGLIYLKDIISTRSKKVDSLLKRSFIIVEDEEVVNIFRQMRRGQKHFALVRDKNKEKDLGILTMEDILEVLLGKIKDEYSEIKEKAIKDIKKKYSKKNKK
ncbi:MAG: CNNM domain-containing protein [Patescibacteria group bacterium]|nr:CNNM domain-containing protein [Patescibacteria group bacterium]